MTIEEFLGFTNQKLLSINQKVGSSSAKILIITGAYKVGTENDFRALFDLKSHLGPRFPEIFADFETILTQGTEFVVQLKYAGDTNLENICVLAQNPIRVSQAVRQVVAKLKGLSSLGSPTIAVSTELSIVALKNAFRNNMAKSGASRELSITDEERYVTIPLHNDLTVSNIMVSDEEVLLIDPRSTIPGSEVDSGSFGCQAIDYAALYVSLYRKNLEREKLGLSSIQDAIEIVSQAVEAEIAAGSYSQSLYNACVATSYSVYVACACDYCMAPERRWLWEAMKEQAEKWCGGVA
jgi:hypothetical protein